MSSEGQSSSPGVPITPTEIAAMLKRIEMKLDLVLERLQWAPQSEATWYAEMHEKVQRPRA